MTAEQATIFAILGGALALFIWDRLRYDLVALLALLAAVATGVVEPDKAFLGFGDDIVIIVGSALVVGAAVARSGIADLIMRPLVSRLKSTESQIAFLVSSVAVLSAFIKNIGALTIFIPVAFQMARRTKKSASYLLMPMSFGALLGGLMTLIGTSPNIVVSRMRSELVGEPFGMFDFLPVGLALTVGGTIFLIFGWRLLPKARQPASSAENAFEVESYQSEVRLPPESPLVGKTVEDLETLGEGDVTLAAIIRETNRRYVPSGHWVLYADDILILQCDAHALARLVEAAKLELLHDRELDPGEKREADPTVVEAVVTPNSLMIGSTVEQLRLRDRYGVSLLALSRHGTPISSRLRRVSFEAGDLVVLRTQPEELSDRLAVLGCLPLAERQLQLGRSRNPYLAPAILAVAMALAGSGQVTVAVAFFGAAVLLLLVRALTLKEAYESVDWPVLVLLGALIPVSEALRTTGGSELVAEGLAVVADSLPPAGALTLIMLTAMAVTPFLNNAATVLIMAPIGASFAARLGLDADPFLMVVALGAACDFLTPIGHQCNTLVMGPGGYRFGDYWRLGLPLSVLVVALGIPLVMFFWPFR